MAVSWETRTLISRSALQRGVSFAPIPNLTIHGENRFFCIRAAVLGLGLYVDTRSPAYHMYREQELEGALAYVQNCLDRPHSLKTMLGGERITLSMVLRNEEGRYLSRVLKALAGHIDEAVIIDDGSTDGTVGLCRSLLQGIPLHIIQNPTSMFANEVELRKKQWDETIKRNPDWILNLDADEVIEESFWAHARAMVGDPANGVCPAL